MRERRRFTVCLYHAQEKSREELRKHEHRLVEIITEINAKHKDKTEEEIKAFIDNNSEVAAIRSEMEAERKRLAQPAFTLKPIFSPVKDAGLVVIDECSMVDDRMGQDLLSFGTKVLVLGDPAQLPPVKVFGVLYRYGNPRRDVDGNSPAGQRQPDHNNGNKGEEQGDAPHGQIRGKCGDGEIKD